MDEEMWRWAPRCGFYLRTVVTDGPLAYHYEPLDLHHYGHRGLATFHPPLVGDLIDLDTREPNGKICTATYKVIERCWRHVTYGSMYWPHHLPNPVEGPILEVVVECAEGLFRHEAPEKPEESA